MALADPVGRKSAAVRRWLSIVGIGEDGADGLSPVARGLIADAELVFGGKRHLALAAGLIRGAARAWPSPFEQGIAEVLAARGRSVCVLASGDPFLYGVGSVLVRHVDASETLTVPAASAFSLAAARLGWALTDTVMLSLHARALDLVRPHLQPGAASSRSPLTARGRGRWRSSWRRPGLVTRSSLFSRRLADHANASARPRRRGLHWTVSIPLTRWRSR